MTKIKRTKRDVTVASGDLQHTVDKLYNKRQKKQQYTTQKLSLDSAQGPYMTIVKSSCSNDIRNQYIPLLDHFVCKFIRRIVLINNNVHTIQSDGISDAQSLDKKELQVERHLMIFHELIEQNRTDILNRITEVGTFQKILNEFNHHYNPPDEQSIHISEDRYVSPDLEVLRDKQDAVLQDASEDTHDKQDNAEDTDEDNTLYCTCKTPSTGKMIACDNPECKIEWFHYKCMNIIKAPVGEWYCPICVQKQKKLKDQQLRIVTRDNTRKRREMERNESRIVSPSVLSNHTSNPKVKRHQKMVTPLRRNLRHR